MTSLDAFLVEVLDGLPDSVFDGASGFAVVPTSVDLDLPIEANLVPGGELLASLPRGRFDSGFRLPLGRIQARYAIAGTE